MNIAIAGYGLEGESSYKYFATNPNNHIVIADQKQPTRELPLDAQIMIGEDVFSKLNGFDIVMRTASLAPKKINTDGKIWSSTNEFFAKCPCPIIGVTGTKGKGTVSSLITSILRADGRKVWLVGNIGVTPLQYLGEIEPNDIVVYEMSSFQLWDLECSPHIAVITVIEPEHLDVHYSYDDYIEAKANIRRYQNDGDICVCFAGNKVSRHISKISSRGQVLYYAAEGQGGVYVKDNNFYLGDEKICDIKNLQLIGEHNIENACAALTVAKKCGVSDGIIAKGLSGFAGLEHRIEFVRELDGVKYYNDSFSSSTPATVAAIKSFTAPEIVIMGGIDRGGDFTHIAGLIARIGNVKRVILIGEIRHKLAEILADVHPNTTVEITDSKNMKEIVELAKSYSEPGDVVLISPGCASFDMFKDFYDRGVQFKAAVNELC